MNELETFAEQTQINIQNFKEFTIPALLHKFGRMGAVYDCGALSQTTRDLELFKEIISLYCDNLQFQCEKLLILFEKHGNKNDINSN